MRTLFYIIIVYSTLINYSTCNEEGFEEENVESSISIRDLEDYPSCVTDEDCHDISKETTKDYRCFQYMCYPWNDPELRGDFRQCQTKENCRGLTEEEGGDGGDGICFRHPDRKKVTSGICLTQNEARKCFDHSECSAGLVCVNLYCGHKEYFTDLGEKECSDESMCRDLFLGELCCYDVSGELDTLPDADQTLKIPKKCCDNEHDVPVITPNFNMTDPQIEKLDQVLKSLEEFELNQQYCLVFSPEVTDKMDSCSQSQNNILSCTDHSECSDGLGCVDGFCREEHHFAALVEEKCTNDSLCREVQLGDFCCYDVSVQHESLPNADDIEKITKRCCDNEHGVPVITPGSNISQPHIDKLEQVLMSLEEVAVNKMYCLVFNKEVKNKMNSCSQEPDKTGAPSVGTLALSFTFNYLIIIGCLSSYYEI